VDIGLILAMLVAVSFAWAGWGMIRRGNSRWGLSFALIGILTPIRLVVSRGARPYLFWISVAAFAGYALEWFLSSQKQEKQHRA